MSNHFLDLHNENNANLLTDKETALKQTFSVDLNNNFINTLFDVIIFDPSDEAGFKCYQDAVYNLNWDAQCRFSDKTEIHLNQDSWTISAQGLRDIEKHTHVVIDNTPLPKGGAFSEDALIAMMAV